ncbi:hypothetical protein LPJ70_002877 [Coemansia sp. RSA 2708]|nr:hypothetical protein LPJ70_002877 [Coemansia sp. RSA 2708]KAJ2321840.1 hypothetical protein IWW52_000474 [Coemansia sp. RSA 2704]KAJ2737566.1 hypothetical protein H4R23_001743 [Coemansia sp. Cherry 401B]
MSTTIDELDFPKAVLMRMIKAGLPENIAIQKEARNSVTKAATVFVSYLAAAANDCAREGGHKTIMSNDVFKALEAVGLADFIPQLTAELEAHSQLMKEKKEQAAKNKAADKEAEAAEDGEEHAEDGEERGEDGDEHAEDEENEEGAVEPLAEPDRQPTEHAGPELSVVGSTANAIDSDRLNTESADKAAASETATAIEPVAVSLTDPAPETDSMDIDDPEAKRARIE